PRGLPARPAGRPDAARVPSPAGPGREPGPRVHPLRADRARLRLRLRWPRAHGRRPPFEPAPQDRAGSVPPDLRPARLRGRLQVRAPARARGRDTAGRRMTGLRLRLLVTLAAAVVVALATVALAARWATGRELDRYVERNRYGLRSAADQLVGSQ